MEKFDDNKLMTAVFLGDLLEAEELLKAGHCPNLACKFGNTAIHIAAANQNIRAVMLLLKFGADINICDNSGQSLLHMCLSCCPKSPSPVFIEFLLACGADPNLRDEHGRTALFYAIGNFSLVSVLLADGANPDIQDNDGETLCYRAIGHVKDLLMFLPFDFRPTWCHILKQNNWRKFATLMNFCNPISNLPQRYIYNCIEVNLIRHGNGDALRYLWRIGVMRWPIPGLHYVIDKSLIGFAIRHLGSEDPLIPFLKHTRNCLNVLILIGNQRLPSDLLRMMTVKFLGGK